MGLLLGALLLCVQRIKFTALLLSAQALRGLCWATKTTNQGQPFACLPFGLRGKDISTSWLVRWLDFILPCVPNLESDTCPSLARPMSYLQALVCLRWAIHLPWRSEGGQLVTQDEAASFALPSPKCSLLSAAAQLRLPDESQRLQGHHRLSSALLYSRDDTIECNLSLPPPSDGAGDPLDRWPVGASTELWNQSFKSQNKALQANGSLPPSLARFLYNREVDNLLSAALNTDEEALAAERAALDSSEAESEELPDENPHSPEPLHRPLAPTLAVDSIGIRLVPWGSVHAVVSTHGSSVQTACGLHFKECSYPVHQIHPDMQLCKRKACMALLC